MIREPYRDATVVHVHERHFHMDKLAAAMAIVGLLGFIAGLIGLSQRERAVPAGECRDTITELGWFTSRVECAGSQKLESLGYDRYACWCKGDEPKASGFTWTAPPPLPYPYGTLIAHSDGSPATPYVPLTSSDAGLTPAWRAAP